MTQMIEFDSESVRRQFHDQVDQQLKRRDAILSPDAGKQIDGMIDRGVRALKDDDAQYDEIEKATRSIGEYADYAIDSAFGKDRRVVEPTDLRQATMKFCPRWPFC